MHEARLQKLVFYGQESRKKKNDEVELEAQCHYDMGERSLACWTISPFKPVRRQRRSTAHPNGWGSAQAPTETGIIQGDMGSHGSLGAHLRVSKASTPGELCCGSYGLCSWLGW